MTPWATGSLWGMTLQVVLKESCSLPLRERKRQQALQKGGAHESQWRPSQPGWETWANPGAVFLIQRPTLVTSWGKAVASVPSLQPSTGPTPLALPRLAFDGDMQSSGRTKGQSCGQDGVDNMGTPREAGRGARCSFLPPGKREVWKGRFCP